MNRTLTGLCIGLAFAFALILGGWPGLLWALLFGAGGLVVGAQLDGHIDLARLVRSLRGRD